MLALWELRGTVGPRVSSLETLALQLLAQGASMDADPPGDTQLLPSRVHFPCSLVSPSLHLLLSLPTLSHENDVL